MVHIYYNALTGKAITPKAETADRTYTVKHSDTLRQIAQTSSAMAIDTRRS